MHIWIGITITIICLGLAYGLYFFLHTMQKDEEPDIAMQPITVPEWASIFTPSQWAVFMQIVEQHFKQMGEPYQIDHGAVHVPSQSMSYGLENLAQLCHRRPCAEWPEFITAHFQNLEAGQREVEELKAKMNDFAQIRDLLMVRLVADNAIPTTDSVVARIDLPGTISYLAIDLPTSVHSVSNEQIEPWGRSREELFAIGLANVRRTARPEIETQQLEEAGPCTFFTGESFFTASHALLLPELPEYQGTYGVLVAVPTRHHLAFYPINDMGVVKAASVLIVAALNLAQEGPGSITARLYWYYQGRYLDLPYVIEQDTLQFRPPDEFVQMLNHLAEESDRDA